MIYKVNMEVTVFKVYSKPFKLYPKWKLLGVFYTKEELLDEFENYNTNPLYEGTITQILAKLRGTQIL